MGRARRDCIAELQSIFGLDGEHGFDTTIIASPPGTFLVSLDLKVDDDRDTLESLGREPRVNQLGLAVMDTAMLKIGLERSRQRRGQREDASMHEECVTVYLFQVEHRKWRKGSPWAKAVEIGQGELAAVLEKVLCDITSTHHNGLDLDASPDCKPRPRPVILVGHSIYRDLHVLSFLGIYVRALAPVEGVLDTHAVARWLLPPYDPWTDRGSGPALKGERFTLCGVLRMLGRKVDKRLFHNAASDALLTLYLLLLLTMRSGKGPWGIARKKMGPEQRERWRQFESVVREVVSVQKVPLTRVTTVSTGIDKRCGERGSNSYPMTAGDASS